MNIKEIIESDNIILDLFKQPDVVGQPKAVQQLREFIFTIENSEISELWRVNHQKACFLSDLLELGKL